MPTRIMRALRLIPTLVGGAIVAMFQVGPSDAETNFCKWIRLLSDASPTCLSEVPAWAMWGVPIVLIVAGIVWTWWPSFHTRVSRLEPSALIIIGVIFILLGLAAVVSGEIWRLRKHNDRNIETRALGLLHYSLPSQLVMLDFNGLQHHDPYFEIGTRRPSRSRSPVSEASSASRTRTVILPQPLSVAREF